MLVMQPALPTFTFSDAELHAPPPDASVRQDVRPEQADAVPVIANGSGLTVLIAVIRQPVGSV